MITLALFVILTALLVWAIHRDIDRGARRRRNRQLGAFAEAVANAGKAMARMGQSFAQATVAVQRMSQHLTNQTDKRFR